MHQLISQELSILNNKSPKIILIHTFITNVLFEDDI